MKGTLVNVAAVLAGSTVGMAVGARLPERIKTMITSALGLSTLLIGMRMAFKSNNVLIVIASMVGGESSESFLTWSEGSRPSASS